MTTSALLVEVGRFQTSGRRPIHDRTHLAKSPVQSNCQRRSAFSQNLWQGQFASSRRPKDSTSWKPGAIVFSMVSPSPCPLRHIDEIHPPDVGGPAPRAKRPTEVITAMILVVSNFVGLPRAQFCGEGSAIYWTEIHAGTPEMPRGRTSAHARIASLKRESERKL